MWVMFGRWLVLFLLIFIGVLCSARLACLLLGILSVAQLVGGVREGRITFVPFFRTIVEEKRHPALFIFAAASHAIVSGALVLSPILSWLGLARVTFLE